MEYKIGDIVRIKSHLEQKKYGRIWCSSKMQQYAGMTASISKITGGGVYQLHIDNVLWHWSSEMFEEINKINFVYVTIRDGVTKFLYIVPQGITLKDGEEVFVQERKSKFTRTVSGGSFEVPCEFVDEFITSEVREKLEVVTGRAIREMWVERPFY